MSHEDIGGTINCTGDVTKRAKTNAENKKALVEEYEQKLQVKHQDKYSRFQIKLWAEMLATGIHTDLDKALAASMFGRDKHAKRQQSESANEHKSVMGQMMTVMNTLCKTLTPSRAESETLSPMKRAELRSKYISTTA